ncbi:unnamed protein product [Paramecium octaurelia]|uniref:Uncharacterized protein n=1 Tax=Paramecium octaurelia TaxID=43137 RepID=A0A8S1UNG6_PAROT|nr:unnamed protein product [Paramecium octaurelia]
MIPQLEQLCDGYNELDKIETLKKHYNYYKQLDQAPIKKQHNDKENFIRQIASEYLNTQFKSEDNLKLNMIIQSLDEEKQIMIKRQQLLPKNIEYDLVNQIINLLDKLKQLYNDKLELQYQNQNQLNIISNLLNQVYNLNKEFTIKMQELSKYNNQIPNEREIQLQQENDKLKVELEQFKSINNNLQFVQQLLMQAETTKQMLQESLKQYKQY